MKQLWLIIFFTTSYLFCQINHFNFFKPYQTTLCCKPNIYGLELQINYFLIDSQTAKLQIPVSLYWGIINDIEVGVNFSASSLSKEDEMKKGVEDTILAAKYNFLTNREFSSFPLISAELGIGLPTGDYKSDFGVGSFSVIINWLFEKEFVLKNNDMFNLIMSLGYKTNAKNYDNYKVGDSFLYSFGSYFNLKEDFIFSFGVKGINKRYDEKDGQKIYNTDKKQTYVFSGIVYNLDEHRKFFSCISIGISENADKLIFNIGMMY